MKLDWNKIVSNAVTVLVASVFVGAAMQLWQGVESIDSRIDANLTDIVATQSVLGPKVDHIEKKIEEILSHVEHGDIIKPLDSTEKGSLELIDDLRIQQHSNQFQQRPLGQ